MITASLAPQTTHGWNPELTLRPFFEQSQETKNEISARLKQEFPPQATTNHLPTIIALQTTKITKLNLLSLLALVWVVSTKT